jgi:hypothetical protein
MMVEDLEGMATLRGLGRKQTHVLCRKAHIDEDDLARRECGWIGPCRTIGRAHGEEERVIRADFGPEEGGTLSVAAVAVRDNNAPRHCRSRWLWNSFCCSSNSRPQGLSNRTQIRRRGRHFDRNNMDIC